MVYFQEKKEELHAARLPEFLADALDALELVWPLCNKYQVDKTSLAMSFALSFPKVSTVIPGIKTTEQATANARHFPQLEQEDLDFLWQLYEGKLEDLVVRMR